MEEERSDDESEFSKVEHQTELMYQRDTIWTAVFNANKKAIDDLIDEDPNIINIRGAVGECPIHMLFLFGTNEHLTIARDLIKRFPHIVIQIYNTPIYYGENILHIAIVKRNSTMVEWLLSNDFLEPYREDLLNATATGEFFQIGRPSYYGEYPLGFACCTNQYDIVEILLKHGADIDTTDSNGNNVLHMLVICNLPEIYAKYKEHWIKQQENQKYTGMKSKKCSNLWDRLNGDDFTPLTLAASLDRTRMLSWLLNERKIIQWSYGNVACVLHPLDQLDLGFREEDEGRPPCVLELIVKQNALNLTHPIIVSLMDAKSRRFLYRQLAERFLITFAYLMIFVLTTVLEQSRLKLAMDVNDEHSDYSRRAICKIGHGIIIAGALLKVFREIKKIAKEGIQNYFGTKGSIYLENCLVCSFYTCIIIAEIFHIFKMQNSTLIFALASIIGWGYLLFITLPLRFTGPFLIMIYKMLFNDVLRFCVIYIFFLGGFSHAFYLLFNGNGLEDYFSTIKRCFLGLLGDFDVDFYVEAKHPKASVSLLIVYVVVVVILLLNLLIAMMGDTYADVKKSAKQLWTIERLRMALDVEYRMSTAERRAPINKYWVEVQGKRYLQVEQVNEHFDSIDESDND